MIATILASTLSVGLFAAAAPTTVDEAKAPERTLDLDASLVQPGRRWRAAEAIQAAVSTAPDVARADANRARARADAETAEAEALPRVRFEARYTRLSRIDNDPLVPLTIDPAAAQAAIDAVIDPAAQAVLQEQLDANIAASRRNIEVPQNQYALSAEVRYPVSGLFLKILPAIRARGRVEAARRAEVNVARNAVALLVVQSYFDHARARAALAVAALSVRRAEDNLAQAEARLANDVGNRPDVLRFRARLAQAEAEHAERGADVEASAEALRTLLHIDGHGPLAFMERLTKSVIVDEPLLAVSVEQAHGDRDEMKALELLIEAQVAGVSATEGDIYPDVSVAGRADYANPNLAFVPPGDRFRSLFAFQAVLSWSPDGAWSASRKVRVSQAELRILRKQRDALADGIRVEVSRARALYRAAFRTFAAAERRSAAAEEAYAARRRGYQVGVFDATSLIDAELDANRARLAVINAGAALRTRHYVLRRAVGQRLWE